MRMRTAIAVGLSVMLGFLATVPSPPAFATEIAVEQFAPSFPIHANGGVGFAGPWVQGGFNVSASRYTPRDRSLCYAALPVAGGSVSGHAVPTINGAIRPLAQPLSTGTVYVSVLLQPRAELHDGIFNGFFGLTLNGDQGNDLFIGKPGGEAIEQYVIEHRGGFGQLATGTPVVPGRTTLLVLQAQLQAGNDVFTLHTDPVPGQPEPGSTVVKTDLDLGTVTHLGIYSTGAFTIDEIRVGTTYADVVPSGPRRSADAPGCLVER